MKTRLFSFVVIIALALSACTLPFGSQPPSPESQESQSPPLAGEPGATLPPVPTLVPEPAPGTAVRWYDGSTLVYVPSGEFLMGHNGPDNPEHTVFLGGFWIYRTKVTNGMYAACVAAGKCTPPGPDEMLPDYTDMKLKDHPVVGITWEQADNYCKWVEGRLPTEAEWEKTARGPKGKIYPWGDAQPACNLANFADCVGRLTHVLSYPEGRSEYDAFDLSGNAFEWVADWYDPVYYSQSPRENPTGPTVGNVRSVRGSAFTSTADQMRPSLRYFLEPEKYRPDLGFRCVIEDPLKYAPPCEVIPYVGEPSSGSSDGGDTPGTMLACEPPPLNVDVATYCQNKLPYANVTLNGAINLDLGGGDCSAISSDLYVCTGADNQTYHMSACTFCEPPLPDPDKISPSCPPGYRYDAPSCTCIYESGGELVGTECPTDVFFTALFLPEQLCCQVELPGTRDEDSFACDPGYAPLGCMCVSGVPGESGQILGCGDFTVSLPDCTRGSNTCSGCKCYTTARDCIAHANQGCQWDPYANVCRGP